MPRMKRRFPSGMTVAAAWLLCAAAEMAQLKFFDGNFKD
jgi:hypothetical protein